MNDCCDYDNPDPECICSCHRLIEKKSALNLFTDEDLKRLKDDLDAIAKQVPKRSDIWQLEQFDGLIARLEAAELALEDADCDCKGSANVCRFYKRREAWKKVAGKI